METLLSVPPALVKQRHGLEGLLGQVSFIGDDPPGQKLGSGGGSAHLAVEAWKASGTDQSFKAWSGLEQRVMVHAGGQSRRLPAYAPAGKALIPIPVFRWTSGQRINQTLLDLQLPLLERLMEKAPGHLRWLIASGDVLVWHNRSLPELPDVDVLCVGLPESPETASGHGVFFTSRQDSNRLQYMLQKPSPTEIASRSADSLYLIDVGIWLLSTRALLALMEKAGWQEEEQAFAGTGPTYYDLYSDFGLALGETPTQPDPSLTGLTTGLLPLPDAEFYHFGRSSDIINSSLALQNRVQDPRRILSPMVKPHPSIFIQNGQWKTPLTAANHDLWIENAWIGEGWTLHGRHVLTGVPENDWTIEIPEGVCIDMVPTGESEWILRPYGFDDAFGGAINNRGTQWMNQPLSDWFQARGWSINEVLADSTADIQGAPLFPLIEDLELAGPLLAWMIAEEPTDDATLRQAFCDSRRVSAETISAEAHLGRLLGQQKQLLQDSLPVLARNADRSVFYQIDLDHTARLFAATECSLPEACPDRESRIFRFIRDRMFRSQVQTLRGQEGATLEAEAFAALRETVIAPYRDQPIQPSNEALADQVVWARSPVRLDIAGGWTDTPPYCFLNGGRVVNLAVELNGQPPIQVFLRVSEEGRVMVRSIDLGVSETIETFEQIAEYAQVGSGFSIPKAALALAGFHPEFNAGQRYPDLKSQLEDFGGGIEITLLCAVPKGSGLGTSSILAATVLGGLSELCGLNWSKTEIGQRVLVIEQMLTTGGGWQDQYGGILHGIKQLETSAGLNQVPEVHWLPDHLFTDPAYKPNLLLYYTGITRVAKDLLGEIVRGMFLNKREILSTLNTLYHHTGDMHARIQEGNFEAVGRAIRRTWKLNQILDAGTKPPQVAKLMESIDDWLIGGKLLGAGGGGYLLMLAKDVEAAYRIRKTFQENPPNRTARFVDMSLSRTGLQVTRS